MVQGNLKEILKNLIDYIDLFDLPDFDYNLVKDFQDFQDRDDKKGLGEERLDQELLRLFSIDTQDGEAETVNYVIITLIQF